MHLDHGPDCPVTLSPGDPLFLLLSSLECALFFNVNVTLAFGHLGGCFSVFEFDDSDGQIDEEKPTHKHQRDEKHVSKEVGALNYLEHDGAPSFKSHTLKDGDHTIENVVKVGHTEVRILHCFATEVTIRTCVAVGAHEVIIMDSS